MKKVLSFLTISILVLVAGLVAPGVLKAQEGTASGQALEIMPPVITLTADPGQTITAELRLRNVSNQDLLVTGHINDFVASGEDGTPKILLDEEEEADNPYSFKDWVEPFQQTLLVPREVKTLQVTINVPNDASPGGHYGVVRFSGVAPELEDTGVSLSASLGTLMLVTVNGDTQESLEIEEFIISKNGATGTFFESAPIQFIERLKNTGNNHLQPSGKIAISDMFGRDVAKLNINLPPRNILPASIRRFEQPLDSSVIGNKRLFGRYTADLEITYGADNQTISQSTTFWVVPYKLIAIVIAILIVLFFILRFAVKRYNRYILSQAKKSK